PRLTDRLASRQREGRARDGRRISCVGLHAALDRVPRRAVRLGRAGGVRERVRPEELMLPGAWLAHAVWLVPLALLAIFAAVVLRRWAAAASAAPADSPPAPCSPLRPGLGVGA